MCWMLERRPELLDAALAERPAAVSLSFGDPGPWVPAAHDAGARVLAQVSDAAQAERAVTAGVDAIVAQGTEAGGHTGTVGTLPLLQLVLEVGEAHGVPVLAAGGIVTGAGVAAVVAAGAAGAWIGTRFMATPESLGTDEARGRLLAAGERDTVHTRAYDVAYEIPWPREYPGRALRTPFTDEWDGREEAMDPAAVASAVAEEPAVYAGQGAAAVRKPAPAAQVLEALSAEAEARLRAVALQ
jgi:nitronate monooxygenase